MFCGPKKRGQVASGKWQVAIAVAVGAVAVAVAVAVNVARIACVARVACCRRVGEFLSTR